MIFSPQFVIGVITMSCLGMCVGVGGIWVKAKTYYGRNQSDKLINVWERTVKSVRQAVKSVRKNSEKCEKGQWMWERGSEKCAKRHFLLQKKDNATKWKCSMLISDHELPGVKSLMWMHNVRPKLSSNCIFISPMTKFVSSDANDTKTSKSKLTSWGVLWRWKFRRVA